MRRKLTITLLASLMMFSLWQLTTNVSAQSQLTLAMVLTGLQTKGRTPETATLAARNVFITKRVQTYGVTFRLTPDIERELRNAGATTVLINVIRQNGPAAPTPTPTQRTNTGSPTATFKDLWIDYDVTEDGKTGMRIHAKFTAYGMKGLDSYLAIYFTDGKGTTLKDKNNSTDYRSSSGDVAVYRALKPGFDPTDYNDLSVFMPYSELDLADGEWNLSMDVNLIYQAGGLIKQLTTKPFKYSQADEEVTKANRIWIDYDVTQNGQRGMRIHVDLRVVGLKGVDAMVVARVQKESGDYLLNNSASFSNDEGQLQVHFDIKPGYDPADFKDASMFLPYNQIKIGSGKWNLKFDIDLDYQDGTVIKHLDFHPFEFERQ